MPSKQTLTRHCSKPWQAGRRLRRRLGGELERVAGLGLPISFAGPGKRDAELEPRSAPASRSTSKAKARRSGRWRSPSARHTPRLAVRVNPPFGLKGSGMKMGGGAKPFGVDADRVPALVRGSSTRRRLARLPHLRRQPGARRRRPDRGAARNGRAAASIAEEAARAAHVNLGGGFGIPYFAKDQPLDVEAVGAALAKTLAERPKILADTKFAIELGRWLVGEAGVYLTRIVDRKEAAARPSWSPTAASTTSSPPRGNFGQLLRRNYPVAIASRFGAEPEEEVTIVGCLCTPLDLLADDVMLPRAEVGDLVAIFCAGAYGLTPARRPSSASRWRGRWRAQQELGAKVQVRPDGRITTPLITDMVAAGKTPAQLADDIREALTQYIDDPRVSVMVDTFQGTFASRSGSSARPRSRRRFPIAPT
jgi:diaminopimelate decarboxylase